MTNQRIRPRRSALPAYTLAVVTAAAVFISCRPAAKTPGAKAGPAPKAAPAGPLVVATDKPKYLRYDIVEVRVKGNAAKLGTLAAGDLAGVITRDGKVVATVGKITTLKFRPRGPNEFAARWPIPWNPPLGTYRAGVTARAPGGNVSAYADFEITGRKVARPPKPFCVVTLESDGKWERLGVDSPGPNHNWKALADWAQFMGADALFSLVGITKALYGPTMENPWYDYNLKFNPKLADECHARGIKFGGWIGAFLPYGKTQVPLP